jgi:hypothetical protein
MNTIKSFKIKFKEINGNLYAFGHYISVMHTDIYINIFGH